MASDARRPRALLGARMWTLAYVPILAITTMHYVTPAHAHAAHDVLRRLYYLPILLGAFAAGLAGGLASSLLTAAVYVPHAFFSFAEHDPGRGAEKVLEIALYQVVAAVAGVLVDRERAERARQEKLASQLREALDDLKAAESQVVRSGRLAALGQLTSGLAHEIRNPLHAIKGTAEVLGDFLPDDPTPRRMLDMQVREIDRLAALLDRFLSFARPAPPRKIPHPAGEMVRRGASLLEVEAARASVAISAATGPDDPIVPCDADQVVQVILNIGLNAIQAMAPAGGRLAISTARTRRGQVEHAAIRIANTGPPIPPEMRERIFDPFVTSKETGTGLGLAISARIVDAHGGAIDLDPGGDGRDVAFTVLLPA